MDTLTYQLTQSDGSLRPNWIGFISSSGELQGNPQLSDSSSYLNLKFTAFETKQGSYSLYKTLLVNTFPRKVDIAYFTIKVNVDDFFAHYFGDYLVDSDGDHLEFEMPNADDR